MSPTKSCVTAEDEQKAVNPRWRVLIGSRSFGQFFPDHITQLEKAGCEVTCNTVGRAYHEDELMETLPGMDAIITGTDQLTAKVINATDTLKTIAKHGVGVDNIDLDAAKARGIIVTYTPGANHDSVADLTLALILATARKIIPAHLETQEGGWKPFRGIELKDKILGIIGLGRIGKAVYQRAQGFGMRVIAYDPYPDKDFAKANNIPLVTLEDLLKNSDIVSLHASTEKTPHPLIGPKELEMMKNTAILINTARGHLVDEEALADALRQKKMMGAGLDVFTQEPPIRSTLLKLENIVLTPHIGGQTMDGLRRMGEITIENCLRALRGEPALNQVV
ncbi:phosphoglycerate dehydrogenase [[Eubacterium] cellulosolvens]